MIVTRSMLSAYQSCERRGYLQYLAPNGTGVAGWDRRALSLPLATGSYVHHGVEMLLRGKPSHEAVADAVHGYRGEVEARGIESDSTDWEEVVEEQCALIEALTLGFERCVLPGMAETYDLTRGLVEQELTTQLANDVTLAARVDYAAPRRSDGRWFLFNWKTVSEAGERFMRQWETDLQLVTETLALEQMLGEPVAGVNVLGMVKGQRVGADDRLIEVRGGDKKPTRFIQRSKLLYGYKADPNPPLFAGGYDWESTTKKGWYKFRTWREASMVTVADMSPIAYWLNWLPEEVVASSFVWVPTIWVEPARRDAKVRQVVGMARRMAAGAIELEQHGDIVVPEAIDYLYPQNEHSCQQYGERHRCPCWDICMTENVASDIAGSGLFVPRNPNHPVEGE